MRPWHAGPALRVAVLGRGAYGLVCVDSLGEYTEARRSGVIGAAKRYAEEFHMQFLFGEATEGPLEIADATLVTA